MEAIIDKIRGILRKEGVTGMESINHCIIFVIARILTEDKCKKYNINKSFAYDNIMVDDDGDMIGDQELFDRIYTKNNVVCLIGQIVNKLGFKNIKFKLESIVHVKQIMKELEKLNVNELDLKYDIIGTIYELHLKSGTSNAMRDLGQYYTNRLVIEFMIKLCNIKMNKNGEIETIIDPTMGTGGFLTMSVKYLNDKYKNKIDWTKNKNRIYGFDIDDNVKNMALLNMLLECGELCENTIVKNDTLYNDFKLPTGEIFEKVDIILANEPMGIKNIIHASCCERIKELKIRGTKAEPLFLQLFMQALNDGGRCAVIVPDGVLFNDSNLHNDTRKYLIENFNLKKVIGLNDDFFLNTGVKTSILFFVKDGKTSEVEFSEVKLDKGGLIENSIIKVDYKKIKEMNYSLFVNKYNAKEIKKIEGVKYEKLGNICELKIGGTPRRDTSKYWDNGTNIWISVSELNNNILTDSKEKITDDGVKNSNVKLIKKNSILMSFKMSVGKKAIAGVDLYTNEAIVAINAKNNNLLNKYIYYAIDNFDFSGACSSIGGGNLNKEKIENLEIPIPSLEVQQKIVEQLDVIHKNIQTTKDQIGESKKIMKYYVETMTLWEKDQKLGDLCETIKTGKNKPKDNKTGTKYPYYATNGINGYTDEYLFDGELILTPRNGTIGTIFKSNGKIFPSDHMFVLQFIKDVNIDFYYYYLKTMNNFDDKKHGSTIPNITKSDIEDSIMKMPSLEKQKEIVSYCDEIQDTINKMDNRIKSNELLMKNIMETYLKTNNKMDDKESEKTGESEDDKPKPKKPTKKDTKKEETSESEESEDEKPKPKKPTKKVSKKN